MTNQIDVASTVSAFLRSDNCSLIIVRGADGAADVKPGGKAVQRGVDVADGFGAAEAAAFAFGGHRHKAGTFPIAVHGDSPFRCSRSDHRPKMVNTSRSRRAVGVRYA